MNRYYRPSPIVSSANFHILDRAIIPRMAPKRPELSRSARATLDRWTRETSRATAAEQRARADRTEAHRRAIARLIDDEGLTAAHVADLLGLTRQWVAQLYAADD